MEAAVSFFVVWTLRLLGGVAMLLVLCVIFLCAEEMKARAWRRRRTAEAMAQLHALQVSGDALLAEMVEEVKS